MTVHETSDGRPLDSPRTVARRRKTETETERTTTSSGTDAPPRGRANEPDDIARIRQIHPLDALTATIGAIRPDWPIHGIRAALANTGGSWHDIARRALTVALDPDTRSPWRITNADLRPYAPTPLPPSLDEQIAAGLLPPRRTA